MKVVYLTLGETNTLTLEQESILVLSYTVVTPGGHHDGLCRFHRLGIRDSLIMFWQVCWGGG